MPGFLLHFTIELRKKSCFLIDSGVSIKGKWKNTDKILDTLGK
jgi:hypothetical protein